MPAADITLISLIRQPLIYAIDLIIWPTRLLTADTGQSHCQFISPVYDYADADALLPHRLREDIAIIAAAAATLMTAEGRHRAC